MKKVLLSSALFLISFIGFSQTKGISYQAVIIDPNPIEIPGKDVTAQPYVSKDVWIRFGIYAGTTLQYEELHKTKTDEYGLVNLIIGAGVNTGKAGTFTSLSWDGITKSIITNVSFDQGGRYTEVSNQKLNYVPYTLLAETAVKLAGVLPIASGGTGATNAIAARTNLGLGNVDNTADADKPVSIATLAILDTKEAIANKSTNIIADSASSVKYPSVKAIKDYVDSRTSSANNANLAAKATALETPRTINGVPFDGTANITIPVGVTPPDANATTKGLVQLAGDLTGTAAAPAIAANSITTAKIIDGAVTTGKLAAGAVNTAQVADGAITNAKITSVAGSKVTGDIAGNAATATKFATPKNINGVAFDGTSDITISASAATLSGTIAIANGGTGATTAAGARTNLGLVIGTDVLAQRTFGTAANSAATDFVAATEKGANNGVATLGVNGKIPSTQIPSISFQSVSVVNSDATMTAIAGAQVGSIAIRSDQNINYVLSALPATTLSNWIQLAASTDVSTINGIVGPSVNLTTNEIPEGNTNKYFTDARVRNAISATAPLNFNTTSGVLSMTAASGSSDGYLSSADFTTFNNKQTALTAGVDYATPSGNITGNAANVTGIVSIANGGTGTSTAAGALVALGAEPSDNKSNDILVDGASTTKFPTFKAIKDYVDQQSANAGVADNSITSAKINGNLAVLKGGTGASTAAGARTNLGLVIGTDVMAANATTALTGDVTGSGNGSFATTVNSVGGVSSSTIATLPTAVAANTASITANATAISTNTASIATNATAITSEATTARAAELTLTNSVNANTASITANANSIATLNTNVSANTASITANATAISTNTTSIATNATAITSEATTARAAELTLTNSLNANTASITANTNSIAANTASITANSTDIATINTNLALKAPLASPTFTGTPTAPTPATSDNSTALATTEYVKASITAANAGLSSIGAISATSNARGATISGTTELILTPADESNGGIVTIGAQTFAGAKTFTNTATFGTDITVNGIKIGKGGGNNSSNTAVGLGALALNTTGSGSTAFGNKALSKSTGGNATAFGSSALENLTTGTANVAVGYTALNQTSSQNSNTAVGDQAMRFSTGANNTVLGASALSGAASQTTGDNNTAIGTYALRYATTAAFNVGVGSNSLNNIKTGNDNTVLGYLSGYYAGAGTGTTLTNMSQGVLLGSNVRTGTNTSTNEIAIGYNVVGNGSNTVTIGNNSNTANYFKGDINLTGNLNGGTWSGTTIGSNYGGAGTVNGILKANGSGVVSAAVAGTDYLTPSGNAASATILATARNINGVAFDGSANITIAADANTLTGTTLASNITASSLTSVGTITSGIWSATTIDIAKGGTGATTALGALTNLGAQSVDNMSTNITTDAASTSRYPSVKLIKDYVDTRVASAGVSDGSITNVKLANSTTILGSTTMTLGGTVSSVIGLTSLEATNLTGTLSGTATALATGRTISTIGDVTYTSGAFDGTSNVTGSATLTNTTVTAGTYGSSTAIPTFTVDSKGRLTAASTVGITAGVSTLAYSTTGASNGGTISGTTLTLTAADASNPGLISTGTQTIAGAKTFTNTATFNTDISVNGLTVGRGAGAVASNAALGATALNANTSGNYNVAVGSEALQRNTGGSVNVALGAATIDYLTSGNNNTAVGGFAGRNYGPNGGATGNNTTMNNGILLGYDARPLVSGGTDEVVIGMRAIGHGSNTVTLGNSSNTKTFLTGDLSLTGNITSGIWSATEVAITKGGTGATTASGARTNLGLGSIATKSTIADADVDASAAIAFSKLNITKANITSLGIQDGLTAGSGISLSSGTISVTGLTTSNLASNAAITNAQLANSSTTLGSTTMTLGGTVTSVTGLTSVSSTGFTGALTGNASTATKLAATKNINGVAFDGSADITVAADANTLTGTTLASNVVTSSLTSVGTITSGVWSGTAIANNKLANSTTILGSTTMTLGGTVTSVTGLTSLTATTVVGSLSGTATTATNIAGGLIGSIPYQTAAGTTALLAGNTTSTVKYLASSGNGTNSTAPTWVTPSFVPYTGATSAVNLGAYDLTVNGITVGKGNTGDETNTALGASALQTNSGGVSNTGIGYYALKTTNGNGTTGSYNVALGYSALSANTTGSFNVASGANTLASNISGNKNSAFGNQSLNQNTTGGNNVGFGFSSLYSVTTASDNTAIGTLTGYGITTGARNTLLGSYAGAYFSTGYTSADNNTTGLNSVFIGYDVRPLANGDDNEIVISGYNGTPGTTPGTIGWGSHSTSIGNTQTQKSRLYGALTVLPNTATGAGNSSTIAAQNAGGTNTAGGALTLKAGNGTGTAAGGDINITPGTTGTGTAGKVVVSTDMTVNSITVGLGKNNISTNTALGYQTLNAIPSSGGGGSNTAIGYQALLGNTSGSGNVALGRGSLATNTSSSDNTAIGFNSLNALDNGASSSGNVAVGSTALGNGQYLTYNTAVGLGALNVANGTSGSPSTNNTALGFKALNKNTTGNNNIGIGSNALFNLTTASNNTAIGVDAGSYYSNTSNYNITGANGVFLGYKALPSADGLTDEVVIGANTNGNGSNSVTIGNTSNKANYFRGVTNLAAGTMTNTTGVDLTGSINDFFQFNVKNTSTGSQAQSGYAATADNGTNTTGFAWMGINNSTFNYPTAYNIGVANDVTYIGSGQDMHIANANNTKSIIFSTGISTTPYFSEKMRITATGNVGIGTNSPTALLEVNGTTKINGAATFSSTVAITTGAAAGKVLTSDATGNATWQNSGGSIATMSATGTATSTATYIIFTGSTASQTITIPSAVTLGAGREITIKNVASVTVTIASAGGKLIQDSTTLTATTADLGIEPSNNWMKLVSDGTNWYVMRALF